MKVVCKGEMPLLGKPIRYYEAAEGEAPIGMCFCVSELSDFFGYAKLPNGASATNNILRDVAPTRRFKAVVQLPGRARPRTCWFVGLIGLFEVLLHRDTGHKEKLMQQLFRDREAMAAIVRVIFKEA